MGILSGFLGHSSEIKAEELEKDFLNILIDGEQIVKAYQVIRDLFVFTDKRMILVDKQGLTGKKIEYKSIPYRCITHFAVETAGSFDYDSELRIWISGQPLPVQKEFKKGANIVDLQKTLATYILR